VICLNFLNISPQEQKSFLLPLYWSFAVAVISYLSLQSIRQKAENLRTKYSGTVNLVRDKLENEVIRLETNLRNSAIEQTPESDNAGNLKVWLKTLNQKIRLSNICFLSVVRRFDSHHQFPWMEQPARISAFNKSENIQYYQGGGTGQNF